jgi:DeoR/GlpR family transcriptional regulator of sugar metabolism
MMTPATGEKRRARILEYLCERESASVEELAQQFAVSRMTVHRDLDQLAAARCVRKTHGGATILSSVVFESNYNYRARRHQEEKRALAAHIAGLIEPGMTVILDDSTTTAALVEFLHARKPLTIITNAASLVASLIRQEELSVICLGGHYNAVMDAFLGVDCEMALERLRADLGVFSAAAVRGGAAYLHESELTRAKIAMKAAAERSFLAFDHTKFGKSALHLFGRLKEFDRIFTTEGADPVEIDRLRASDVPIEIVPLDAAFEDAAKGISL